jgi:hypothetical protein
MPAIEPEWGGWIVSHLVLHIQHLLQALGLHRQGVPLLSQRLCLFFRSSLPLTPSLFLLRMAAAAWVLMSDRCVSYLLSLKNKQTKNGGQKD